MLLQSPIARRSRSAAVEIAHAMHEVVREGLCLVMMNSRRYLRVKIYEVIRTSLSLTAMGPDGIIPAIFLSLITPGLDGVVPARVHDVSSTELSEATPDPHRIERVQIHDVFVEHSFSL